ncbi:hypothetical protein KY284_007570 [Solanum tuberosum]|nr:hypothetical protein KY284_007570 [Solanum tuberosum]
MSSLITLGLVETLFDPVVDNVKRELLGATTIKRARLDDQQLVVFNKDDMINATVRAGVNIGAGVGFGVQSVGATSCSRCSGFLCAKCKKHDEDSIMYLKTLSQVVNEFKNKRRVKVIPSKNVRDPCTPQAKRRKKSFIKAIQNLKKKIFGEFLMAVGEKLLELKHYIDETLCLMRERHLRYLEYYDSTDRILDLNFYTNFKQRGIRPYPGGLDWIGAKRILAVMNLNKTHFVTLEILLHEGRMNQSGIMKHLPNKFLNEQWEFEGRLEPMVTNDTKAAYGSFACIY